MQYRYSRMPYYQLASMSLGHCLQTDIQLVPTTMNPARKGSPPPPSPVGYNPLHSIHATTQHQEAFEYDIEFYTSQFL